MKIYIKGELTITTESGVQINSWLVDLLKLVDKTGSLNTAVKEMGISYSHAWNTLYKLNCQLNSPMINSYRGGKGGGLAELTENGKKLIKEYEKLKLEFKEFLEKHAIEF